MEAQSRRSILRAPGLETSPAWNTEGMTRIQERRERYLGDGYVVVRGLVDTETRNAWSEDLATRTLTPQGLGALDPDGDPVAREIASHPPLRALASELLDGEVASFGVTYVVKAARTGLPALWHQDGHPWRSILKGCDAVTLWVALDATTRHNGALVMIPQSHRGPLEALVPADEPPNVFGWTSPDSLHPREEAGVVLVMDPGDVSAHDPAMVHGSGPNSSPAPRRALSIRYRRVTQVEP